MDFEDGVLFLLNVFFMTKNDNKKQRLTDE